MRIIDADNFKVFHYIIPNDIDEDSFGLGIEYVLERIDNAPTINHMSPACRHCGNHPANGGSGICHCILGNQVIY